MFSLFGNLDHRGERAHRSFDPRNAYTSGGRLFAYIVGTGPGGTPGIGDAGGPSGEGRLAPPDRAEPVGAVRVPNALHAHVLVAERSSRIEGAVRVGKALHALLLAHIADAEPATGPDIALVG